MENLETDFERAQHLQTLLIATATGPSGDNRDYQLLRQYFLEKPDTKPLIPSWVRTSRDLAQFWQFIKYKFPSYAERRTFIWSEFAPLLEYLEVGGRVPTDYSVSEILSRFDLESVHVV